ncbi:hypothetical protein ACFSKI_22215 [Pseudogracilibacillus auburnensis]|uniref:Type IV pilus assembly protein PilO n=1 Tax=Pseudogracilibacillus auburnensis TaxID=1494959 RepID=A0A2V3VZA6_9BACI|nr:hypothetical protein [Pseudogracilibacillus auburnensis]MBO1003381.1 hypothetical protein [Pseudogracilibacillus auburnensis]PXW85315.1 hypothetical protein DFR56_11183 [Pseudogracilibacillus auburnensis]
MNEYLQINKRPLFILAGLLFIFAIVLYFIFLRPLLVDLTTKEEAVQSIEKEIQQLKQTIKNKEDEIIETEVEQLISEKKIPLERELDEYILGLQQLEVRTNSKIDKIEFIYDSNINEEVEDMEDQITELESNLLEGIEEQKERITIDPTILKEMPENLQIMTVKVTAASPDFEELIHLIKAIEKQERISIVSKLEFFKPAEFEAYFLDELEEMILFEVELTTFYYTE